MKVDEELVSIGLEAVSKEEALRLIGQQLLEKGFVKENFIESIIKREETYPTGLPTEPFGVAIPHTDADMVNESKIAFASLKEPVKFAAMGSSGALIDVKLIFMLALKDPNDQLTTLQKLVGLFQDPDAVARLASVRDAEALNEVVESGQ